MLLSELLKNAKTKKLDFDAEITSIVTDSRLAEKDCVFFCMNGRNHNSAYHAKEALEKGAAAVISEKELESEKAVRVESIEKVLAMCCDNFYGNPSKELKCVGVTGTNGKTSVAFMIKHIFDSCGRKTGIIGTTGNYAGSVQLSETGLTTPKPVQLYQLFSEMVKENTEYCIMEVSSQALAQGRCEGLRFETAGFTNLTPEHLDYHGIMEKYAEAKAKLFEKSRKCILNLDDEYYGFFREKCRTVLTYSVKNKTADLFAENIIETNDGIRYKLVSGDAEYSIYLACHGLFSVSNSLAAIGCCVFSGISIEKCVEALSFFSGVKGRAEVLNINAPFRVMIDYAHTPDAVENILSSVRKTTNGRVISLFGCGGDRDKSKRPLMLRAAAQNSDYIVITSDNPRNENPYDIIKDILSGLIDCAVPFAVIENRKHAIEYALKIASENDTVVLCGKGHETYQITGSEKTGFDERKIVYNILKNE